MNKKYSISLDIGTNSVGWAVMSEDLKLIRKKMKVMGNTNATAIKKNFWGVRLFESGETAEDRRLARTTRRRYTRRKYRITELQKIFEKELMKKDSNFFHRLNESFQNVNDKEYSKHPIFGTIEEEVAYHEEYPTIYHLRRKISDTNKQIDIRLIYLALAHIIKYRGHFLLEGELNSENTSIAHAFSGFIQSYNEHFNTENQNLDIDNNMVAEILKEKISRTRKFEKIMTMFIGEAKNGPFGQFLKLIVGNQGNFKNVFELTEEFKLEFSKVTYEEDLEQLMSSIDENYLDVFLYAKTVFDAIELSGIISSSSVETRAKLSSQMITLYEEHQNDLATLKKFIKSKQPSLYFEFFSDNTKNGYAGYIDGSATQESFYKYAKNKLEKINGSDYFLEKIDRETFLRKQRSFYNGVIPHQIHLEELRAILEQQQEYYPFLKDNAKKIEMIFKFRIPYYVGPLANGNSNFAWLVRKNNEGITPWNFDDIVNKEASAEKFINRMTNNDTYLPDKKVLPKRSLLYQKYLVFNELTKVSYIDDRGIKQNFSKEEKLDIFNSLFKTHSKVSKKMLIIFLRNNFHIESPDIKGIEDNFNASYSTYFDLNKINGMKEVLDNPNNEQYLEEIIKILTIFEDREMRRNQLKNYTGILTKQQINQLTRKHYTGWGRLSAYLINEIRDEQSNKSILDYLIDDSGTSSNINRNFMQLINDERLSFKSIINSAQRIDEGNNLVAIVNELPGSPAIKKGILQSLKVVEEIITIMGYFPSEIVIEMAKENQTTEKGRNKSTPRLKMLEKAIKDLGSDILKDNPTDNDNLKKERLFLYYLQNGKDMYTREPIDINNLSNYDIDHIIPQSFITDNSISNKVLVSSSHNRGNKANDVPSIEVVKRMRHFWSSLLKAGLMNENKFNNLTKAERGGLSDSDKARFLKRQLVETRQITKHVAGILDNRFNPSDNLEDKTFRKVKIITLKSSLTSQFRKEFNIPKVRSINDVHHAHDAYLNAVIAHKLLNVYPQLEPEFIYGEYPYYDSIKQNKATAKKQKITNIMKFFSSKEPIISSEGEIVWDFQRDIKTVKNILKSKQVNIVKKTEVLTGGFSDVTIQPRGNSSKLIPIKNGLDPAKYGGLSGSNYAYNIALKYTKGKKVNSAVIGITIMEKDTFEKDEVSFLVDEGYANAQVIAKLPKYTLYEFEDGRQRMIVGASEVQKANQFILPNHLVELLYHSERYEEINHPKSFNFVNDNIDSFSELLSKITLFAAKFNSIPEKKINLLNDLYTKNKNKGIKEITESFVELTKLNSAGAPESFRFFGVSIDRHRYRTTSEILKSVIIHQSITGLYETRTSLEVT